MKLIVTPS